jgi:hypothetical protein
VRQAAAVAGLGQVTEVVALPVGGEQEPGLGRDGDAAVRVQHQLEQRGARPRAPDDEDRPDGGHDHLRWASAHHR